MISKRNYLINLLLLLLANTLTGCDGADSRRANYIEEGKRLFNAGDTKKAQTAFNNALQIDPEDFASRYEIAETLSKLGDIQSAVNQYQLIVNQDARHLMARVKLGQIYLSVSKIDEAEKMAKEALAINPESTDAMVLMGQVYAAQNNSDAAFVKAEEALAKKPDDVAATLLLVSLYARSGKIDKAISLLQHNIEKNPADTAPRLLLANLYNQTKAIEKVQETLASIIKVEPKHTNHRKRLAIFLLNNNQLDKAESVLREAINELPEDQQARLLLVEFLANQRSAEVAMAELIPMIEENAGHYDLRFKLADLQMALKQPDKVEETLKEIVELDKKGSQSIRARNKLARLYLATRRVNEAKTLVKELLVENPGDFDAITLRGEFALAENRPQDAISDFRAILVDQPKNIKVLKLLGAAHLLGNDKVLAQENMEKVLEIAPKDEQARLDLVNLLLQTGATEQATQQLNTLFKLNPNSKNGLEVLFKIYLAQQQWTQAQQIARQLEALFSDDATGYFLSGLAYQAEGKFDKSLAKFELAMAKKPDAIEPLTQMVKSYLALKLPDKALNKLNGIVKNQPKNFFAYSLMGDVYGQDNQFNEAINAYQKAIEIKPQWNAPYRSLALIHRVKKHKAEAIKVLQTGINNANEANELVSDLATIYHEDGLHQKVIALYEDVYRKNPDSLNALNNLASYLSDYASGSEEFERAGKLAEPLAKTNDSYMLDTVGWIAYKQGNYQKSQQILLKAIALNPDIAISNYHLGMSYFKQGNKNQAKEHLQKAINTKENFNGLAEAKEVLKSISGT